MFIKLPPSHTDKLHCTKGGCLSPNRACRAQMEMNPGVRKSAPYGQACLGCSKAKCKCISRGPAGTQCERCHRLNKDCQPSIVVRKGPPRRPVAGSHRTAQLEEKLESLVTLLQARSETPRTSGAPPDTSNNGKNTSSEAAGGVSSNIGECLNSRHEAPQPGNLSRPASTASTSTSFRAGASSLYATSTPVTVSSIYLGTPPELPADESDRILETFQRHHLETFPFVYLPGGLRCVLHHHPYCNLTC
jgi:hypothetical protein